MDSDSGLRRGVQSRLEFIEFRLFWEGHVNRSDLIEVFGVSINQASTDLNRYLGLAEAYIENGDFALAKNVLHVFLNMKLNSQKEESVLEWRTEALNFLKKIPNQ